MILVYDVPFNSHNIFSVPLTDSKLTQLFIKRYVQFTMFINIDDTAKLADIKSTLCLYRISVVSYPLNHFYILDITYIAMLAKIKIKSCLNRTLISCLHRRHCRYCNACQYQFSSYFFLSHKYFVYMFDIVKIAMLANIESTLCLYRTSSLLFTSPFKSTSSRHRNND